MSSASTGEPPPFTRNDFDTARRMARKRGVYTDADDVTQEAMIAIARYPRPLVIAPHRAPDAVRKCILWGFVRRQVARHRSQRARDGERVSAPAPGEAARILTSARGAAPSVEDRILEYARITLLRAAVEQLRAEAPELYAVLHLELEGVSIARIAADLEIPLGTAYTRSRLGREAVRAQLRRWEDDDARGAVRIQLDAMKGAHVRCS